MLRMFVLCLMAVGSTGLEGAPKNKRTQIVADEVRVFKRIGDVELKAHLFFPETSSFAKKRAAIVFFFGGGWITGTPQHFFEQSRYLANQGMVVVCPEYRVKNRHKTTPIECVQDGKSAMRWVRKHADELGVDSTRLAAGGGSAGGHVAAATALLTGFNDALDDLSLDCRPNALVLFNPVFNNGPGNWGYNRVKDYWKDFSPAHNIDADAPPTLIMHGTFDHLIPVSVVEEFRASMQLFEVRCDLFLYGGMGHSFFNKNPKKENRYRETLMATEQFLESLGYLSSELQN